MVILSCVCSFALSVRWFCYGIVVMSLLAFSCQEDPVSVESPDPEKPFIEYRAWTQPERIEGIPDDYGLSEMLPTSLSTSGNDDLHLLIRNNADGFVPPERLRLGYLLYDGTQWALQTEIDGYGWFTPSTSVAVAPNRAHLFWGGIMPERQQEWLTRSVFSSDLFHCLWNGTTCTTPTSLSSIAPSDHSLRFAEAMQDHHGQIHLIADLDGVVHHHVLDAQGQLISKTPLAVHSYPRILTHGDTLHYVYMDSPQERGTGQNDLYYQAYHDGVWTEPVVTFHDEDNDGHHPALAIDAEGGYHLAFYAHDPSGPVTTMYTHSENEGQTWAVPEALFTNRNFFFRAPQLVIDGHGILHLTGSHVGATLSDGISTGLDSYYAARREGQWSEVQRLYPEYEPISEAHLVVDGNDVVHVVFRTLDRNIYHVRFE